MKAGIRTVPGKQAKIRIFLLMHKVQETLHHQKNLVSHEIKGNCKEKTLYQRMSPLGLQGHCGEGPGQTGRFHSDDPGAPLQVTHAASCRLIPLSILRCFLSTPYISKGRCKNFYAHCFKVKIYHHLPFIIFFFIQRKVRQNLRLLC